MALAWTDPRDWIPGELVDELELNSAVRDNLKVLSRISIATVSGSFPASPLVWSAEPIDEMAAVNNPNAYLSIVDAGYYQLIVNSTWSGATGTGGQTVTINRNNASDVLQESWGSTAVAAVNTGVCLVGFGYCAATDRLAVTLGASATGSSGTIAVRGVLLRRR